MSAYIVRLSENARDDLVCIDQKSARRILDKLDYYALTPNPLRFAKRLMYAEIGEYRFRIGDYRVIFDCNKKGEITILLILKIGHRKDIYSRI